MGRGRRKTNAEFVAEVKALVGDEYTLLGEYKRSNEKVSFRHAVCGNTYPVSPNSFLKGGRCPYCRNNGRKTDTEFKTEVEEMVGKEYVFLDTYKNNRTKLRVKHNECLHEYTVRPDSFLRGSRCPKCNGGGDQKSDTEFKTEVEEMVGKEYVFLDTYKNNRTKLRVKHNECLHEYTVRPDKFLHGSRCPNCNESKGEKAVSEFLYRNGLKYTAELPIRYSTNKSPLRIDFFVEGIAIEYDGQQHFEPIELWGGERALRETQRRDRIKNEYCAKHGIPMIRIPYWDFDRIDEILTEKLLPLIRKKDDKLA